VKASLQAEALAHFHKDTLGGRTVEASVMDMKQLVATHVRPQKVFIFMVDTDREILRNRSEDPSDDEIRGSVPLTSGLVSKCARTGNVLRVESPSSLNDYVDKWDRPPSVAALTSMMLVPLLADNSTVIGVIQVLNSVAGSFSSQDETFLTRVASSLSAAFRIQLAHQHQVHRETQLQSIMKCTTACFLAQEYKEACVALKVALHNLIRAESITLYVREPMPHTAPGEAAPPRMLRLSALGLLTGRFNDGTEEVDEGHPVEEDDGGESLGFIPSLLAAPKGSVMRLGLGEVEERSDWDKEICCRSEESPWIPCSLVATALRGQNGQPNAVLVGAFLQGNREEFTQTDEAVLSEIATHVGVALGHTIATVQALKSPPGSPAS